MWPKQLPLFFQTTQAHFRKKIANLNRLLTKDLFEHQIESSKIRESWEGTENSSEDRLYFFDFIHNFIQIWVLKQIILCYSQILLNLCSECESQPHTSKKSLISLFSYISICSVRPFHIEHFGWSVEIWPLVKTYANSFFNSFNRS